MSTARALELISEEEYLAGEESAAVRHEYLAGRLYAMTGASTAHNVITSNVLASFHGQLRGKSCRALALDMKVRVQVSEYDVRFYYPDVVVVCDVESLAAAYQREPTVIVEVISESTRRTDEGEKKDAYFSMPSLTHYILLEQHSVGAVAYQRDGDRFDCRTYRSLDDTIVLEGIGLTLALRDAYEEAMPTESGAST